MPGHTQHLTHPLRADAQPEAAPAPAPAAGGPAANTQFTLLAANASFTVAADNTTTLELSGALPTVVYTQSAPVRDVGCAPHEGSEGLEGVSVGCWIACIQRTKDRLCLESIWQCPTMLEATV